jgi:hexosaminidase
LLWTPKKLRDSADFEKRLTTQFRRYDLWGVNYSKAYFDLNPRVLPTPDFSGVLWNLEGKQTGGLVFYSTDTNSTGMQYEQPVKITRSGNYFGYYLINGKMSNVSMQKISVNKATGKKATLITQPARNYQGDGAFTLVNGVQNEKGLDHTREFLGFSGNDAELVIDLGSAQQISSVKAHVFDQTQSWIYPPKYFQVLISSDNSNFTEMGMTDRFENGVGAGAGNGVMEVRQKSVTARYVKIKLGNYGTIPQDQPGGGNKAWLFADEIEIN